MHLGMRYMHISYILWGRNSKFGVWMCIGMVECCVPFRVSDLDLWPSSSLGHCDLDLVFRIWCISPIFFEVETPNLECACTLGWRIVVYNFWVTVILTSDLVSKIIVSWAYLLYHLRLESKILCVDAFWDNGMSHIILGSLWPWPLT